MTSTVLPTGSRRVLIGLRLAMGGALVGLASLNYVLTPMSPDLGIDEQGASLALACVVLVRGGQVRQVRLGDGVLDPR